MAGADTTLAYELNGLGAERADAVVEVEVKVDMAGKVEEVNMAGIGSADSGRVARGAKRVVGCFADCVVGCFADCVVGWVG